MNKNQQQIGKTQIIDWVNHSLNIQVQSIESLGTGVVYCQLFNLIYPGIINLSKIHSNARYQHDYLKNLKILQQGFYKQNIKYPLDIQKLSLSKFLENFELIKWFYISFYNKDQYSIQNSEINQKNQQNNISSLIQSNHTQKLQQENEIINKIHEILILNDNSMTLSKLSQIAQLIGVELQNQQDHDNLNQLIEVISQRSTPQKQNSQENFNFQSALKQNPNKTTEKNYLQQTNLFMSNQKQYDSQIPQIIKDSFRQQNQLDQNQNKLFFSNKKENQSLSFQQSQEELLSQKFGNSEQHCSFQKNQQSEQQQSINRQISMSENLLVSEIHSVVETPRNFNQSIQNNLNIQSNQSYKQTSFAIIEQQFPLNETQNEISRNFNQEINQNCDQSYQQINQNINFIPEMIIEQQLQSSVQQNSQQNIIFMNQQEQIVDQEIIENNNELNENQNYFQNQMLNNQQQVKQQGSGWKLKSFKDMLGWGGQQ